MNIFTSFIQASIKYNDTNNTLFTIKYIIVATVFLLLLWWLSKWVTKQHGVIKRNTNIKVVERIAISNDKFIYLVELDQIFYLIGSDKSGMTVIDKREHLNIETSKSIEPQTGAFFEQLKSSIIKRENKAQEAPEKKTKENINE